MAQAWRLVHNAGSRDLSLSAAVLVPPTAELLSWSGLWLLGYSTGQQEAQSLLTLHRVRLWNQHFLVPLPAGNTEEERRIIQRQILFLRPFTSKKNLNCG